MKIDAKGAPTTRWQGSLDAVVEDTFRVQGEIATRVAEALRVVLGAQEQQRLAGHPTTNLAAYDAYLHGEAIWSDEAAQDTPRLQQAITHCEQAVALDPSFAITAYLGRRDEAIREGERGSRCSRFRATARRALLRVPGLALDRSQLRPPPGRHPLREAPPTTHRELKRR